MKHELNAADLTNTQSPPTSREGASPGPQLHTPKGSEAAMENETTDRITSSKLAALAVWSFVAISIFVDLIIGQIFFFEGVCVLLSLIISTD